MITLDLIKHYIASFHNWYFGNPSDGYTVVVNNMRKLEKNMPIPVVITVYQDKSFTFTTKTAPVSFFLKKAAGLNKGGQEPGRSVAGKVTEAQVREIAEQKMGDMNAVDVDGAMAMVRGSARAMGLDVVEG